jgi:hypothetical protein
MFYSLQEAAERLGKTEEQIQEIVKQGRLREFRDGLNLLYKVDEVEALTSDTSIMASGAVLDEDKTQDEADEISLVPEVGDEPSTGEGLLRDEDAFIDDQGSTVQDELAEDAGTVIASEDMIAEDELIEEGTVVAEEAALPEDELAEEGTIVAAEGAPLEDEMATEGTVVAGEGINVLEETESDFQLSDDTQSETKSASGLGDLSLEEIEEDVNLDTFGSGSGLLDLSLQADDTSLGGILDEIYTAEGEEEQKQIIEKEGTALDVAAEAEQIEQIMPEEEFAEEAVMPEAAVMAQAYVEPLPDKASNLLGIMLLLPLLAVVYTATVMLASFRDARPAILTMVQAWILPVLGGIFVVAIFISGAAAFSGGGKTQKQPKPKAEKKPKEKKPKKPKKEKKKKEKKKKGKKGEEPVIQ